MLYQALAQVGRAVAGESTSPLDWVRDPLDPACVLGIALVFGGRPLKFLEARLQEFSPSERDRLAYVKGPTQGGDFSPLSTLFLKDPTCKLPLKCSCPTCTVRGVLKRLRWSLQKLGEWGDRHGKTDFRFAELVDALDTHRDAIQKEAAVLAAGVRSHPERKQAFAYLALEREGRTVPLVDEPIFAEYLPAAVADRWAVKDGVACRLSRGLCAVCTRPAAELLGNFSELSCFNLDEPSFIAGGLTPGRAARNFPVCLSCAQAVCRGLTEARRKLHWQAGGLDYFLLPDTGDPALARELVALVEGQARASLEAAKLARIKADEEQVLHAVGKRFSREPGAAFSLMFYRGSNSQWHLLRELPEILPGRLTRIFDVQRQCERLPVVGWPGSVRLRLVRRFSTRIGAGRTRVEPTGRGDGKSQPDTPCVLDTLEAIFSGKPIPRAVLLRRCVQDVRQKFTAAHGADPESPGGKAWHFAPSQAFLFLEFLRRLDVFPTPKEALPMNDDAPDVPAVVFLREHPAFFHCPELRAAFLAGVLTGQVAHLQWKRLKSRPFLRKLHGLRLDRRRLSALIRNAKAKVLQYEGGGLTHGVEEGLALEWVQTAPRWAASEDEVSLCFSLGLTLQHRLAPNLDGDEKNPAEAPPEDLEGDDDDPDDEEGDAR